MFISVSASLSNICALRLFFNSLFSSSGSTLGAPYFFSNKYLFCSSILIPSSSSQTVLMGCMYPMFVGVRSVWHFVHLTVIFYHVRIFFLCSSSSSSLCPQPVVRQIFPSRVLNQFSSPHLIHLTILFSPPILLSLRSLRTS